MAESPAWRAAWPAAAGTSGSGRPRPAGAGGAPPGSPNAAARADARSGSTRPESEGRKTRDRNLVRPSGGIKI